MVIKNEETSLKGGCPTLADILVGICMCVCMCVDRVGCIVCAPCTHFKPPGPHSAAVLK